MKRKYIWFDGRGWVPAEELPRRAPRVQIVSDAIPDAPGGAVKSMADGQMYTSKSRLRAEYRARGFEEIGNEIGECTAPQYEPPSAASELERALAEAGVG